jgi:nitrogen fixation protein NifU and related proteins
MSELRELYQQVILDHNRAPRNFRKLGHPTQRATGDNPLCGDSVSVEITVDDGVIRDIGFQGSGCAISRASASMMTASVKGKTVAEAEDLFARFHRMLAAPAGGHQSGEALARLDVFAGVREFPARVKCATLPWHTLHAALEGSPEPVSNE